MELADWHMWWKERGWDGVRRLLMDRWDPIGVAGTPEAADEYDSYVSDVGERLRSDESPEGIVAYLAWVRVDRMGLPATELAAERDRSLAEELLDWYRQEMASAA